MKYLVVMRECFECDNNTPSDKIWAKIAEFKNEHEKNQAENIYLNECVSEGATGACVDFYPLEDLKDEWVKVGEIW